MNRCLKFLPVLLVVLVTSCASKKDLSSRLPIEPANEPVASIAIIQEVPVVYTSIPEVASKSTVVILGRVAAPREILNTARVPGEPGKPDPQNYSVGQVYEVKVDEYLLGEGPKTIYVIQHQGMMDTRDGPPTEAQIEQTIGKSGVQPLRTNVEYLMFLRSSNHIFVGYSKDEIFGGTGHPWLFDVSNPDCIRPVDSLEYVHFYFPPLEFDDFTTLLKTPLLDAVPNEDVVYPTPPAGSMFCPENGGVTPPYP